MIAFTALVPLALLLASSVTGSTNAPHGSLRESRHRRGMIVDEPIALEPRREMKLTSGGGNAAEGIGAKAQGWWLSSKTCQGSNVGKCLSDVDFAGSWKDAKAPSSSSSTTSHVSSSSSRSTSSHQSSSTHHPSSQRASSTHSHHSPAHTSSHASPKPRPSSGGSSSSSGSGSSCRAKRSNEQFGFSTSRFEDNAVRAHNDVRAKAGVGALTWSADLAATAATWAGQCSWAKSESANGENLAAGYPNISAAVREWGADSTTEQYSQLVDAQVTTMGCAVRTCDFSAQQPDVFDFGPVKYYVCAYDVATSA